MNPVSRLTLLTALSLAILTIPRAQATTGTAMTIGLFDVPRLVLSNSLAEKQRRIDLRMMRLDVRNQPFLYFPTLGLSYSGGLGDVFSADRPPYSHAFSLSSSWQILQSGDRWLDQSIQRIDYQDLQLATEDDSQQEIFDALGLYFDCLTKKLQFELASSNESLAKVQYEYVVARKAQGRASDLDILNAQAAMDSAVYDTASGRLNFELSLLTLGQKLRVGEIDLPSDPLAGVKADAPVELAVDSIPQAVTGLIAYKRIELNGKKLKLEQTKAFRQRFIPSVDVSFDMNWYDHRKTGQTGYRTSVNSFNGGLNLGVSLPLFEQNVYLNAWKKTRLEMEKQALSLQETKEAREAGLLEAVQNLDNELLLLPVAERRLESSRLNYERMAESYSLGVGSLLDLNQASKNYRDSLESMTALKVDLVLLRASIGYLLGDTMRYLR